MDGYMRKLDLQEFVDEIYTDYNKNDDSQYLFFLGAGCSKSSGIPLAGELAEKWYEELKEQKTKFDKFNKSKKIPSKDIDYGKYYFEIFEELFPTPLSQQQEIQRITNDKEVNPSLGYYVLASLMQMKKPQFNTIITTNFDNLIQDALIYSGSKRARIITHQDLSQFIKRDNTPLITKVHGDAHLNPFNNKEDTKKIPEPLKGAIQSLFTNAKVIFIGYRGDDESIVELLKGCTRIDQVYWLSSIEPNNSKIVEWWDDIKNKTFIPERDFDMIMNVIKSKFKIKKPNFEELTKKLEGSYDCALEEEINEINKIEDKSYIDYLILGHTYYTQKKYDNAMESYNKAVEINSEDDTVYFYMALTYGKREKYDKAIELYKKAIKINSHEPESYNNLFELQMIIDKNFDKKLEIEYSILFKDDKEVFIKYDMLKILSDINNNKEVNINYWLDKYKEQNLYTWSFTELETWIETKSSPIKEKLLEAIEIFKTRQLD